MPSYVKLDAWSVFPPRDWVGRAEEAARSLRSRSRGEVRWWRNRGRGNVSYVNYVYVVLLYYPEHEEKFGLYVGRTHLRPSKRLQNHKKGIFANEDVKKYGKKLMPEIYKHLNPMRPREAPGIERALFRKLRDADLGWVSMGKIRPPPNRG